MNLNSSTTEQIARQCHAETRKYLRKQQHNPTYCYEVIRLALTQQDQAAYTYMQDNYYPIVTHWVRSHMWFKETGETIEFIASGAFIRFYYGAKRRFPTFPAGEVAPLLKYLHRCVHSEIVHCRDGLRRFVGILELLEEFEDLLLDLIDLATDLEIEEFWHKVDGLLPEVHYRLLIRLRFTLSMSPQEISEAHPEWWEDARAVSKTLQTIKRRLVKGLLNPDLPDDE